MNTIHFLNITALFHWLILYRTTTNCYLSTKGGGAIWYHAMTMAVFGMEYLLTTYCVVYYLYTMEACFHHRIKKTFQLFFSCNSDVISQLWHFPQNCEIYVSADSLVGSAWHTALLWASRVRILGPFLIPPPLSLSLPVRFLSTLNYPITIKEKMAK